MVKIYSVTILLVLSLQVVCKANFSRSTASLADTVAKPHYNQALLNAYSEFLSTLNAEDMKTSTIAAKKYVKLFKHQDKNTCDSAFMLFNNYFIKALPDSVVTTDINSNKFAAPSKKLRAFAEQLKTNGFKIAMSEGETYVATDPDFRIKWFSAYVSPAMKTYLIQLDKEDKEGFEEDAGLIISSIQFADRTVWWEKFNDRHPHAIIASTARYNWKNYLSILLNGIDNTPLIDYGSNTLSAYYKTAYTYLEHTYPNSQTSKLVKPYFKLLLQHQKKKAKALLQQYEKRALIY